MTDLVQRWRDGWDSYRRPDEPIRVADYDVAPIPADGPARAFVERHHYSRSYPAARWRFGLYERGQLAGVAVFSHPMNDAVITRTLGVADARDGVELGRFVLLDRVPGNGESWFLARCFRQLRREGLAGVVSFSDPCRRVNAHGAEVFGGHLGVIYQATNARYVGRSKARTHKMLPDGRLLSPRAMQKIRGREQGVGYAVGQLVAAGAEPPTDTGADALAAWLAVWTARLCRNLRHRGNHKYVWGWGRGLRLPPALPYPKAKDAA